MTSFSPTSLVESWDMGFNNGSDIGGLWLASLSSNGHDTIDNDTIRVIDTHDQARREQLKSAARITRVSLMFQDRFSRDATT